MGQLQNMGCQNQHFILENEYLRSFIKQLLDEKDQDKLTISSFQGKVQGQTKAHVVTVLDEKVSLWNLRISKWSWQIKSLFCKKISLYHYSLGCSWRKPH